MSAFVFKFNQTLDGQGPLSERPDDLAPENAGYTWWDTDNNVASRWDGATWYNISSDAEADLAEEIAARIAGDALLIPLAQKAAINGVATLGSDGKILDSQIPNLAITDVFVVTSQAAMLALNAQVGDIAKRSDLTPIKSYILMASPASTLSNWTQITPDPVVTSINGRIGDVVGLDEAFTITGIKTANYVAAANEYIPVDTTTGTKTITLPTSPTNGTRVGVKHIIQGSTNTVSIICAGSDVFNKTGGGTTLTLTLLNQGIILQYKSSGAIWYVQSDDLALSQLDTRYSADSNAVHITGTETITGLKTFSNDLNITGRVGIGTTFDTTRLLSVGGTANHPGSATALFGIAADITFPSTTTLSGNTISVQTRTAAASFTLTTGRGLLVNTPVLGASSAITTQYGIDVITQTASGVGTAVGVRVDGGGGIAAQLQGGSIANLWLNSDTVGSPGGIALGTARDVAISRGAANQAHIASHLSVSSRLTVGAGGNTVAADKIITAGNIAAHSGTATTLYGVVSNATAPATTTVEYDAYYGQLRTAAATFTLTTSRGLYIDTPVLGAGSAITTAVGAQTTNQGTTGVSTAYGLLVNSQSGAAGINAAARLDGGTTANLWLNSDTASIAGGIALGTARDTSLVRAAAGVLRTPGGMNIFQTVMLFNNTTAAVADIGINIGNGAPHPGTGATVVGISSQFTAPGTATSNLLGYDTFMFTTASLATGSWIGYKASGGTPGASSTITSAYGFYTRSYQLTGVTTSYGFYAESGNTYGVKLDGGTNANLWLNSNSGLGPGGILFGTAGDVSLSRLAGSQLQTSGKMFMQQLRVLGTSTYSDPGDRLMAVITGNFPATFSNTASYGLQVAPTAIASQTNQYGLWVQSKVDGASIVLTNSEAFHAETISLTNGGAITTQYGFRALNQSGATTSYGLSVSSGSTYAAELQGGSTANLWLNSDTASILGGITFGSAKDTSIIRSAAGAIQIQTLGVGGAVGTDSLLKLGAQANHSSSATTIYGEVINYTAPATATVASNGIYSQIRTAAASFTLGIGNGISVDTPVLGASSAITTLAGLRVFTQAASGVGTATGIIVNSGSSFAINLAGGTIANLWLNSDNSDITGGMSLGTARDTGIYRLSSSQVAIANNLAVANRIAVGNNTTGVSLDTLLAAGATASHPNTNTTIYGIKSDYTAPSTATVASLIFAGQARSAAASFTLTGANVFTALSPSLGASSAITTIIGFNAANQGVSGVTNAYGVVINAQSAASGISVAARLDGGTQGNLWLNSNTATVAGGIVFGTAGDTKLIRGAAGRIDTDALTLNGNLTINDSLAIVFSTANGGRIGTGTSQKIGFWGVTPITQPTTAITAATFVTNTSLIANDTATWDGYTIGQIVKALRNAGLLS